MLNHFLLLLLRLLHEIAVFNGKSLERAGSVTEEVLLCSGLVDDGFDHRRYMEPRFIVVSSYPTSWAYSRNIRSH